ncbi:MAG: dTMP kinase [Candidatus Limnocylindrales bacterium]
MGGTPQRGRFVTFEGPDGSGKSTQAARLAAAFEARGVNVLLTREPGGTLLGERVREILLDRAGGHHSPRADALLFNAARAQLVDEVIEPALARGAVVVCDRYADSTLAYQGRGSGLPLGQLAPIGEFATRGLRPDLTILLDLPVAAGLARRVAGAPEGMTRFESADAFDTAFHERVRAGFLELARAEPGRWRVVDADRDPEAIAGDVLALAWALLGFGDRSI